MLIDKTTVFESVQAWRASEVCLYVCLANDSITKPKVIVPSHPTALLF